MGNPNSRRARRRQRARNDANPNLVYWMGRWMVRTYSQKRIEFADGSFGVLSNETWNEPAILEAINSGFDLFPSPLTDRPNPG